MTRFLKYALELGIAAVLMWVDIRLFWLYFFLSALRWFHLLRAMARVNNAMADIRLGLIIGHLGIPQGRLTEAVDRFEDSTYEGDWKSLERDLRSISRR
jgi:hypothetical protein